MQILHLGVEPELTPFGPVLAGHDIGQHLDEDGHLTADCSVVGQTPAGADITLISGSWQEWAEPTAPPATGYHLIVESERPWTAERLLNLHTWVHRHLDLGRVYDWAVVDHTPVWGEHEQIWIFDGRTARHTGRSYGEVTTDPAGSRA